MKTILAIILAMSLHTPTHVERGSHDHNDHPVKTMHQEGPDGPQEDAGGVE